jgi:cytochrome c551/c552
MNKAIISFVICALLGFGLGYLVFGVIMDSDTQPQVAQPETNGSNTTKEKSNDAKEATTDTVSANKDNILNSKGCLGCHAVESLGLQGGVTGPDLSKAFENVEGKHGKPIDEFLKVPTSAVMSGVIGGNPLTDDERKQVLELLQQASEK